MLCGVLSGGGKCCSPVMCACVCAAPLLYSQVPLQLPSPSGSTGHIEETSSKRAVQRVWADIPKEIERRLPLELHRLKEAYASFKAIAECGEHGLEFIKHVFSSILGGQTVESVVHVADDSWLVKEQVLSQRPDLGDVVTLVLPRIQVRAKWKRVGLGLGMKKNSIDKLEQQFSNDDDRYLETLSYWLEHGSSVTWKTLLDVLGHFETWHTVDELTGKIVSVLGGGDQVSMQVLCVE